jgi:dienelactone hydrolase
MGACVGTHRAQGVGRIEISSFDSLTVSTEQFLTGDKEGKPVRLGGQLRLPLAKTERFPAVILAHPAGGISAATERWAQELNGIGVAAFIMDSFTGRGVHDLAGAGQVPRVSVMVDGYRALALLAEHPRIDPHHVAIMGFSVGGAAALYTSVVRFKEMWGVSGVDFDAHIAFYAPCNTSYRDDDKVASAPIRLFHGINDDMVSIVPCRAYVDRLEKAGADVSLAEYPGAYHIFDNFTFDPPVSLPHASSRRNCLFRESDNGCVVDATTGIPPASTDLCVEKGVHFGYDAAATAASTAAVKAFLIARFALK